MTDSAQTRPDSEAAWQRHYSTVAQRQNEAGLRRGKPPPYLRYRRRELRLAYAIAVGVVGLLLAAWASV